MEHNSDELFDRFQNQSNFSEELERNLKQLRDAQPERDSAAEELDVQTSEALLGSVKNLITSATIGDVLDRLPETRQPEVIPSLQVSREFPVAVAAFLADRSGLETVLVRTPAGSRYVNTRQLQETALGIQNSLMNEVRQITLRTFTEPLVSLQQLVNRAWDLVITDESSQPDQWRCLNPKCRKITSADHKPDRCWNCGTKRFEKE